MDPNDLFDIDEEEESDLSPKLGSKTILASPSLPVVDGDVAAEFREDLLHWLVHGKTEPPRAPGLHCSSLWKTCPRVPLLEKRFAQHIEVKEKTAGQRMTFDVGHALHDLIQNVYLGPFGRLWGRWKCLSCQKIVHEGVLPSECPECGIPWRNDEDGTQNIVYAEMFVVDDTLNYCGHCDGILLTRAGRKLLFEFKTISKSQYKGLRQPKHEHVIQCHAYMHTLGIKEAIVLYWDKGSQCDWVKLPDGRWQSSNPHLKVFLVRWDQGIWDDMSRRIRDYRRAEQRSQELPVVEVENVNEFPRVCNHKGCDLAGECVVRDFCFAI